MRVAALEGGTTDFFFLRGELDETIDGCLSSGEEEDVAGFLWPFEGRRETLFFPALEEVAYFPTPSIGGTAADFLLEEPVATPLAFEGAMENSMAVSKEVVADSFSGLGTGVADLRFFPALVFFEEAFLGEWDRFLEPFSTAGSIGISLLLPFPHLEGMIRCSSTILTDFFQPSGKCVVYTIQPFLVSSQSAKPSFWLLP